MGILISFPVTEGSLFFLHISGNLNKYFPPMNYRVSKIALHFFFKIPNIANDYNLVSKDFISIVFKTFIFLNSNFILDFNLNIFEMDLINVTFLDTMCS